MKVIALVFLITLTGCRSTEVKQIVWFFWPMNIRLGSDISALSRDLHIDTTRYSVVGYAKHIKQYTLSKAILDKLEFEGKFLDSVGLGFYNNKLFAMELYASGNPNVEHLKLGIRGGREGGFTNGGVFKNHHTELSFRSRDGQYLYEYDEDIVDNLARLMISNKRMLKLMPSRQRID